MKKSSLPLIALLFLYLILFPSNAVASAREGLLLWYHFVVPVLFPFMLLCSFAMEITDHPVLPPFLTRPLAWLFGCSEYGAFAVAAGFLCGFPMGAKLTSDLYHQGKISRQEAHRLCGFANNLSPGFILSYLAVEQLQLPELRFAFLLSILGAAAAYGILTAPRHHRSAAKAPSAGSCAASPEYRPDIGRTSSPETQAGIARTTSSGNDSAPISRRSFTVILDDSLRNAVWNTVRMGVYIMFFSILSGALLSAVPLKYPAVTAAAASIEITAGIRMLAAAALPWPVCFPLISALGAFGGFSALAQSAAIAHMDKQLFFHYIKSRVAITLLSVLLSCGMLLISHCVPLP